MSGSTHLQDQQFNNSNNEHRKESFIEKSLHRKLSEQTQDGAFEQILNLECNKTCADCPAKGPRWVSIDYGVFICMNCAGAHRMLGRQNTRVRSVKLDSWTNELIQILQNTGNKISNDYFEFKLPINYKKPGLNSSMPEIQKFITDKYINKKFSPEGYPTPVQEYLSKLKSGDFKSLELKSGELKPKIDENKKIKPITILEEDNVQKKNKNQDSNNNWTKFYENKNVQQQQQQQADDLLNIDSYEISQPQTKNQEQKEEDLFEDFQTANATFQNLQQLEQNNNNVNQNNADQFTDFVSNQPYTQTQHQSEQFTQFQQSTQQNNQQQQQLNLYNLYNQNKNPQQQQQQSPQNHSSQIQNQQSNYSALDSLSFNANQLQLQQQQQQQMMLMRQQQEMMMRQNQLQYQQMQMGYGNQVYNQQQQFMQGGMATGGYNNMYPQQQFQMNNQFNTQNNYKI